VINRFRFIGFWLSVGFAMAVVALAPRVAFAQQRGGAPASPAEVANPPALTPLKVTVTLSKYQGQKQISHLPYTLSVTANDRKPANVTTATQVLIPMITVEGKTVGPVYKDVGTKVECSATSLDGGRFRLEIEIEDSSVYGEDQPSPGTPRTTQPSWLKSFRSTQTLILRDGQTMQYTSAMDKTNGDEVKVDVALTVVK
jgi:hypothetical protein